MDPINKRTSVYSWLIVSSMILGVLISPLMVSAQPTAPDAPNLEEIIPVDIHTMPLELKRIYRPNLALPDSGGGLFVENIKESSLFYKKGLRSGMVIRRINQRTITTRKQLTHTLANNVNSTIDLEVWKPGPGATTTFTFRYHLEQKKVVSYKKGPLYHDPELEHSPDPDNNLTYRSRYQAQVAGREACPVCFPRDDSTIWTEVIHRGIGPTNPIVQRLIEQHGKVTPVSDFIESAFRRMTRYRLRYQLRPRLIVLDTRKLFASGTPDGVIVLSRGILTYAEGLNQKRLLIAHMLAHVDARHPPRSIRLQQATNILQESVDRIVGVGIGLEEVGDFLFNAFGFTFQKRWKGLGYDEEHEREAQFLKYYYLRKVGVPLGIDRVWDTKRRDLVRNLNENWVNHLVLHPTVETEKVEQRWKREIRASVRPGGEQ